MAGGAVAGRAVAERDAVGAVGVGEDGNSAAGDGLGGEVGAVRPCAGQCGEEVAGPHVRGAQGDPGDLRPAPPRMIVSSVRMRPDLAAFRTQPPIIDDGGDLVERNRPDRARSRGRSGRGRGSDRSGTGGGHGAEVTGDAANARTRMAVSHRADLASDCAPPTGDFAPRTDGCEVLPRDAHAPPGCAAPPEGGPATTSAHRGPVHRGSRGGQGSCRAWGGVGSVVSGMWSRWAR